MAVDVGGRQRHDAPRLDVRGVVQGRSSLWLIPLVYAALSCLLFSHLTLFDGGRLPGCACEDPVNEVWFLAFTRASLASGHLPFWTDLIGAPAGVNAAGSASFPLLGFIAWPLTALAGPIVAYNFLLRLGLFLSALCCWLVLRRVVKSELAAGLGGLAYGFSPYMAHVAQQHIFLVWGPLPPLIFYLLYRQLAERRGRPWVTGALVGLMVCGQYLIDPEVAVSVLLFAALTTVLVGGGHVVSMLSGSDRPDHHDGPADPAGVAGHRSHDRGRRSLATELSDLGVLVVAAAVVMAVLLAYPAWQYLYGRQHVGLIRPVTGTGVPAVTTLLAPHSPSLITPTVASKLGLWTTSYGGGSGSMGYLGPILLAAIIVGVIRYRRLVLVQAAAVLFVLAGVMELGPDEVDTTHITHTKLPMGWLLHLHIFRNLVAARMSQFVWLAAAVIIAVMVDALITELRAPQSQRRWSVSWSAATVTLTLIGLVLAAPAKRIRTYPTGDMQPFLSHRIQSLIPTGGLVLTYPYPYFPFERAMLWQALDNMRFRLVGGYANFPGTPLSSDQPPLLHPKAVPCFFSQAMFPRSTWTSDLLGGCLLAPINVSVHQLRTFVTRNHIAAIVVDRVDLNPQQVIRLVTAAYGPPTVSGSILAWRT